VALGSGTGRHHHGDRPALAVVAASSNTGGGSRAVWRWLGFTQGAGLLRWRMTVRDMLTALQVLPRDAELLAFEAGCEDYCEREVDEVEWQGGRVYLHLGARRDDLPRG
jgi:hypothetical protein